MSYTVDIVAGPVSRDDRVAWAALKAMREELYAQPGQASPEMRELHDRLTARYPCICDDEAGPWSDGPLINNFGSKMVILGVVYSRADEVLPFILETASAMGFTVFDGQDERIYRPGEGGPERSVSDRGKWWHFWRRA